MTDMGADPRPGREHLSNSLATAAEDLGRITVRVNRGGQGAGSGTIWRPDGWIVTNAHVAHRPVSVALADGRRFDARVMSRNPGWDLAAIKIDADGLQSARIGHSDTLAVGELVLAMGYPFGLASTLTAGVVHATGRPDGSTAGRWIQADLRLAPGNSGGPMANARGEVVGINAMIAGDLALAIPSRLVEGFLASVTTGGSPRLGVAARPAVVQLPDRQVAGYVVLEVKPESPAANAGLLVGDVLIGADGGFFRGPDDLVRVTDALGADHVLRLELLRGRARMIRDIHPARRAAAG